MVDVILIRPGSAREVYQCLADEITAIEPPLWTRMIAGWLMDHGVNVMIIDQEAEGISDKEVADIVKDYSPEVTALVLEGHQPSASTQQMTNVNSLLMEIHGRCNTKSILVGNHVSALPEQTFLEEICDFVCDGEGPITIFGLLSDEPLENVEGLVWFDDDENLRRNKCAPLIHIDDLHGDVWGLLPMGKYRAHQWQCLDGSPRQPYASIYTTLGCPFKCSFCMINAFQHGNTYRRRTPEKVIEQIDKLYTDYGVKTFKFADEMFVLDPSHYLAVCERLAELPYAAELNIWAYARIDTVKPETLSLMRRAGIRWLALGIESASSYVRDGSSKHLKNEDIRNVVKAIQESGIYVIGNFIFGLPDDTKETMEETLNLAKSLDLEFANFYSAMAYPGSKLFEQSNKNDLPETWLGYSQHSFECKPLPTKTLTSGDIVSFRDFAFRDFYNDQTYRQNTLAKFGEHGLKYIDAMANKTLNRKYS